MKKSITIERLTIYFKYGGDITHLINSEKEAEKDLFGENINKVWENILVNVQDIEWIAQGLRAQSFTNKTLKELEKICDTLALNEMVHKIPFSNDFRQIADILNSIKNMIHQHSEVAWAGFDTPSQLVDEMNEDIKKLETCNFETLDKMKVEFLPTGTYQELSASNKWGEEYLILAKQFDKVFKHLTKRKNNLRYLNLSKLKQKGMQNTDNSDIPAHPPCLADIKSKILDKVKNWGKLTLVANKEFFEVLEFANGKFVNYGGDTLSNLEEYRNIVTEEQALELICAYYRDYAKTWGHKPLPELIDVYNYITL